MTRNSDVSLMAKLHENYVEVGIEKFNDCLKVINFDLYLWIAADRYVKAFDKASGVDFQRVKRYIEKGVKSLFVLIDIQHC